MTVRLTDTERLHAIFRLTRSERLQIFPDTEGKARLTPTDATYVKAWADAIANNPQLTS